MSSLQRTWGFVQPYNTIFFFMVVTVILPVAMELVVPPALRYVQWTLLSKHKLSKLMSDSFRKVGKHNVSSCC